MHPTTRRASGGPWCRRSAVVGAVLLGDGAEMLATCADSTGANAGTGLALVTVVLTLVSSVVFPMAAAHGGAEADVR